MTLMVPIASGRNRPPASTEACSMADTNSRSSFCPCRAASPASARAHWPRFRRRRTPRPEGGRRRPRRSQPAHPRPAAGPCRPSAVNRGRIAAKLPGGSHRLPSLQGEAAWSHSSRDRSDRTLRYNITYRSFRARHAPANSSADLIAIGDRRVCRQSQANVLNELRDVQDACFLPLASC